MLLRLKYGRKDLYIFGFGVMEAKKGLYSKVPMNRKTIKIINNNLPCSP